MRKHTRDQLLNIIPTIWEGVEYALKANNEVAAILFNDCYDAIEMISNLLEEGLSEEKYNDYKIFLNSFKSDLEKLSNGSLNEDNNESFRQQLFSNLNFIQSSLINEAEVKLEIVFMPYSASMWDCMESIWRAATQDQNCECYVVPIPYYERTSSLGLGDFHYEGQELPKYVPIVDYQTYDIRVRKPDVIYIHNPYDGNNRVTSVDPQFYSNELKKHTEMLVYVPYYVSNGTIPEGHALSPALQYVDKIIVQSEDIRNKYSEFISPEKLIALGSPKIDRVLNYEKGKSDIPKEWKKVVGDKKILLFNTSLTGLLKYGSVFIDKLKYVFEKLSTRNDIVILWRPHPLSEQTISSMRPQLLRDYYQIEHEFKTKNIGIFDQTPDIERAISISDAYYGDGTSSVIHMYGITGKSIMEQDINIVREPDEEELHSVWFSCGEFDGDYAWLVCGEFNGLFKVNTQTGTTEKMFEIPEEKRDGIYLYGNILKFEDKLILVPVNGKELAVFDLSTERFNKIPIKKINGDKIESYLHATRYKNYIFVTPFNSHSILRYDIKTGECKYYTSWYDKLIPYIKSENKPIFANGICVKENLLLMALAQDNLVMEFDMESGNTKFHTVGKKGNNYWNMTYDGKDYWLIQNENKNAESIVKWNYETKTTTEYFDFPSGFVGEQNNFNEIVFCGDYLLVFPRFANMILKIDIKTGMISEFESRLGYNEGERNSSYNNLKCNYYFAKRYSDNYVLAMSMSNNSLIKIDINTEKVLSMNPESDNETHSYISFENYKFLNGDVNNFHFSESKFLTLNKFLDYITSNKSKLNMQQINAYRKVFNNSDGTSGEKTHRYIIENLL